MLFLAGMRSRLQTSAWLLCSVVVLVLQSGEVHAQGPSEPSLEIVDDSSGCVSAASLRARVKDLMADQPWPSELSVELQLTAADTRFSVSKRGAVYAERHFERSVSSCAERRDAIAVAIVLAVENYLVERQGSEAPSATNVRRSEREADGGVAPQLERREVSGQAAVGDPRGRDADAASEQQELREVQAEAAASLSLHGDQVLRDAAPGRQEVGAMQPMAAGGLNLYAGGQWLWAAAPSAAAALAAGGELSLSDVWSVGVGGVWAPRAEHVLAAGPKRVAAQLFAGQVFGCWNARGRLMVLQGCGGAAGGVLDAEGRGFEHKQRVPLAWGAVLLRAAAQWPAQGALALRARADARVNVLRPEPEVPDPGGFTAPVGIFGADLGIDLLWRLR